MLKTIADAAFFLLANGSTYCANKKTWGQIFGLVGVILGLYMYILLTFISVFDAGFISFESRAVSNKLIHGGDHGGSCQVPCLRPRLYFTQYTCICVHAYVYIYTVYIHMHECIHLHVIYIYIYTVYICIYVYTCIYVHTNMGRSWEYPPPMRYIMSTSNEIYHEVLSML